ncbi:ATP-binding cassette domain-containing protein [Kurthia sibirica]|uniref:ATP-binding cassette domain-containing protein n=1 Tax=Kurthia sibirica TaxID=202750 RepID=UPI0014736DE5|nr:ATP-binding cassette domain-containing protein [Kurthia sibirica]
MKEEFIKIENFSNNKLKNIDFSVGKGEILGLYGLVGSGRTELLRAIYGADQLASGNFYMNGQKKKIKSPSDAVDIGIGLVPENRKTEGANLDLSILDNAMLSSLSSYSKGSFMKPSMMKQAMLDVMKKLNIKAHNMHVPMSTLSGGNQQKVIIAKWLVHKSKLLLFDEPTQGIDIGAKDEIYSIMKEIVNEGSSIIVATSEIDELLAICDRVLILFEGEIIKEFSRPSESKNDIMNSAVSG